MVARQFALSDSKTHTKHFRELVLLRINLLRCVRYGLRVAARRLTAGEFSRDEWITFWFIPFRNRAYLISLSAMLAGGTAPDDYRLSKLSV
jgi:hypothetical protein